MTSGTRCERSWLAGKHRPSPSLCRLRGPTWRSTACHLHTGLPMTTPRTLPSPLVRVSRSRGWSRTKRPSATSCAGAAAIERATARPETLLSSAPQRHPPRPSYPTDETRSLSENSTSMCKNKRTHTHTIQTPSKAQRGLVFQLFTWIC